MKMQTILEVLKENRWRMVSILIGSVIGAILGIVLWRQS